MLRPGHWCSSASGGVRSALRSGPALQGPTAARGALLVTCSGPGDLQQDPSRLEPTRLPGLVPVSHRLLGARALQSLTGAKQINLREWGTGLGGTLVVDDASHKEEVQQVRTESWASVGERRRCRDMRTLCSRLPAQAVRAGTLSFGFSAGGCLFPYYIGCAGALIDGGVLTGGRSCRARQPPACTAKLPARLPLLLTLRLRLTQLLLTLPCRGRQGGGRLCRLPAGRLPQVGHAPGLCCGGQLAPDGRPAGGRHARPSGGAQGEADAWGLSAVWDAPCAAAGNHAN